MRQASHFRGTPPRFEGSKQDISRREFENEDCRRKEEALETARARFSGSLHVEDLEGDIRRTWEAMRMRANPNTGSCTLSSVSEELAEDLWREEPPGMRRMQRPKLQRW